jgi:hypothetical protein
MELVLGIEKWPIICSWEKGVDSKYMWAVMISTFIHVVTIYLKELLIRKGLVWSKCSLLGIR